MHLFVEQVEQGTRPRDMAWPAIAGYTQKQAEIQRYREESDMSTERRRIRRWLAIGLLLCGLSSLEAQAQFATGGSGRFRSNILWFDWGNDGAVVPAAGTSVTNTFTVAGQQLRVTCSISNLVGGLVIGRPGSFTGDGLDDLYNVGGTGTANTMDIALKNSVNAAVVDFTFDCSATLGAPGDPNPAPYPLDGLVFADAEQSQNASGQTEYTQGTIANAGTTWRIIDRFRNCTTAGTPAILTQTAGQNTLRLNGASSLCTSGPMGVAFMEGTTTASVQMKGGGISGIALGAVIVESTDYGDAPLSYGNPVHTAQFSWTGGTLTPNTTTDIHAAGFTLASLVQPTARLGNLVDSELNPSHGANANGDDTAGSDDEDGFTTPLGIIVAVPGQTFTSPTIACSGGGTVRGWIDFNRDGDFNDANEVANSSPVCNTGSVTLNWTVPVGAVPGRSYMRLRTASNPAQIATADGTATDGEVEDYLITALTPAKVVLSKQIASRLAPTDQFTVSVLDGETAIGTATTAGVATTATTGEVAVDVVAPYTLRDANGTGSALLRYVPTLACVANPGSTGAVPVPTGPTGTGPADWSITFNNGNDLTCTITNTPNLFDLSIAKTDNVTSVVRGDPVQYVVTVTNNGPGTANGPTVTDPAAPGLDCPAASPVVCTGPAGACPAGPLTIANLQTGIVLGTLSAAAGSNSLTLQFTCTAQ